MKNVVTIGGGTGTFVVLSGLRTLPDVSLFAIVSAADDGGSTGHLRDAYGFLPAGDTRQALVALAEEGNVLRDLFAYRFTKSEIAGHNLGNLFLTALTDLLGSDTKALAEASKILRIRGTVIPATESPAVLVARREDGSMVMGESSIDHAGATDSEIREVMLEPSLPMTDAARDAINEADLIVLGPGSLYTSTIAALLPTGMREAIAASSAKLAYIANLFTRPGETPGYTLDDHVQEIVKYAGRAPDYIFVNNAALPKDVLEWYAKEDEHPIKDDLQRGDLRIHRLPLASIHVVPPVPSDPLRRSLMRHDPIRIREALEPIINSL